MSIARLCNMILALAVVLIIGWCSPVFASEVGSYPPGLIDLEAGVMPPPGGHIKEFLLARSGDARRITEEGKVETHLNFDAFIAATLFLQVTKTRVLDSNYAWGILVPAMSTRLAGHIVRGSAKPPFDADRQALASPLVCPIMLGWKNGMSHQRVMMIVYMPLGSYDAKRMVDTGTNRWGVDLDYGFTFENTKTLREFSAFVGYTYNFINPATDYLSGQEFHIDYCAVQRFPTTLGIGLTGYVWVQTTPDRGSGAKLGAFEGRTFALGPLATYKLDLGGRTYTLTAKYYSEFGVRNRIAGQAFWFNISAKL